MLIQSANEYLGALALLLSAINIFGGFSVSTKMIQLFRRPTDPKDHFDVYIPSIVTLIGGVIVASYFGFSEVPNVAGAGAAVMCISSIANLSSQKTARWGNFIGMVGVATGIVATLGTIYVAHSSATLVGPVALPESESSADPEAGLTGAKAVLPMFALIIVLISVGGSIGLMAASKVSPTELPQTVAAFHSLVGKYCNFIYLL